MTVFQGGQDFVVTKVETKSGQQRIDVTVDGTMILDNGEYALVLEMTAALKREVGLVLWGAALNGQKDKRDAAAVQVAKATSEGTA